MSSDNDMLKQVWLMQRTILKGQGHLHRIGGYVCGRTSNDDPYIILYPDGDLLVHKAVRVYKEQLKQLPPFINIDNIEDDAGGGNPDKEKAKKKGIYRECPLFEVMTYDGKDTQMGPEKRFSGVLRIVPQRNSPPPPQAHTTTTPPHTTPPLSTTPPIPTTTTPPPSGKGGPAKTQDERERWIKEAQRSQNWLMFSTAIDRLYGKGTNAVDMVMGWFNPPADGPEFEVTAPALYVGVATYFNERAKGTEHAAAKESALEVYRSYGQKE